jgi:hypothetical protein
MLKYIYPKAQGASKIHKATAAQLIENTQLEEPNLGSGEIRPIRGQIPKSFAYVNNYHDFVKSRFMLRNAWNNNYIVNNSPTACTPFRAINNSGDLLSRQAYSCGGNCQTFQSRPNLNGLKNKFGHIQSLCDASQIPPAACNQRFVADNSEYVRFLKLKAINKNYNDLSYGGDQSNATQSVIRAIRRY